MVWPAPACPAAWVLLCPGCRCSDTSRRAGMCKQGAVQLFSQPVPLHVYQSSVRCCFSWARQPLSAKGYCCESGCLFPQLKTPESHGPEASWPATWEGSPPRAWIIKKVHRFLSVWKPVINRGLSRDCENLILMFLKGEEPVFVFNRGSVGIFSVWDGWYLCALRKVSTSGVSLCPPII